MIRLSYFSGRLDTPPLFAWQTNESTEQLFQFLECSFGSGTSSFVPNKDVPGILRLISVVLVAKKLNDLLID